MKSFISFICLLLFVAAVFLGGIGFEAKISQNWEISSISFSHSLGCFFVFFVLRWASDFMIDFKEK
jgi:hypothetical protein